MEAHVTYEVEECACGHISPVKFNTHDDDGNSTCPECQIEYLNEVIKELLNPKKTSLRTAIKNAITENSNVKCLKVWDIEKSDPQLFRPPGHKIWTIEVEVKPKKKKP